MIAGKVYSVCPSEQPHAGANDRKSETGMAVSTPGRILPPELLEQVVQILRLQTGSRVGYRK